MLGLSTSILRSAPGGQVGGRPSVCHTLRGPSGPLSGPRPGEDRSGTDPVSRAGSRPRVWPMARGPRVHGPRSKEWGRPVSQSLRLVSPCFEKLGSETRGTPEVHPYLTQKPPELFPESLTVRSIRSNEPQHEIIKSIGVGFF